MSAELLYHLIGIALVRKITVCIIISNAFNRIESALQLRACNNTPEAVLPAKYLFMIERPHRQRHEQALLHINKLLFDSIVFEYLEILDSNGMAVVIVLDHLGLDRHGLALSHRLHNTTPSAPQRRCRL